MTGIRPGEKIHEILVSEEEAFRTTERAGYYVLRPAAAGALRMSRFDASAASRVLLSGLDRRRRRA